MQDFALLSSDSSDEEQEFHRTLVINEISKRKGKIDYVYHEDEEKITFFTEKGEDNETIVVHFLFDVKAETEFTGNFSVIIKNSTESRSIKKTMKFTIKENGDECQIPLDCTWEDLFESEGFVKNDSLTVSIDIIPEKQDLYYNHDAVTDEMWNRALDELRDIGSTKMPSRSSASCAASTSGTTYCYSYQDTSETCTKYVGLKNQGATCYMNSMLQSLFHIPAFRRIVYRMPTNGTEDAKKNIPLNLQRLFYKMQFSGAACSTVALTKSFGWKDEETIVQHDVQEFCRVLIDNLEMKLKGHEGLENMIADIFKGKTKSFIRCNDINYESAHYDDFYDLSLEVKDTPTLEKSFEKFVEPEQLCGDNQYEVEGQGKHDALMGTEFIKFPSVLHLHLRRFEYDFQWDRIVKINDKFEFPEEIDLDRFLAKDGDRSKPNVFQLFGVLVHSGGVSAGHYYAFLRTSEDPQWYEFNDSTVSTVTKEKAINDNFGGGDTRYSYGYSSYQRSYSGYFLVYVRKVDIPTIFRPVDEDSIPQEIKDWYKHEKEEEASGYSSSNDSKEHDYKFYPEESISYNMQRSKIAFAEEKLIKSYKVEAVLNYSDLYDKASELLGLPRNQIRLWQMYYYKVPYSIIDDKNSKITYTYYTDYFVQKKPEDEPLKIDDNKTVLYLAFFFPKAKLPLQFLGYSIFKADEKFVDIEKYISKLVGYPEDTPLDIYEFTSNGPRLLKIEEEDYTLKKFYISSGSFLIFQVKNGVEVPETTFKLMEPANDEEENKKEEIKESEKKEEEIKEGEKKEEIKEGEKKEEDVKEEEEKEEKVPRFIYGEVLGTNQPLTVETFFQKQKKPITVQVYDYANIQKHIATVEFQPSITLDSLKEFLSTALKLDYVKGVDGMLIFKKAFGEFAPSLYPIFAGALTYDFQNPDPKTNDFTVFLEFEKGISDDDLSKRKFSNVIYIDAEAKVQKKTTVLYDESDLIDKIVSAALKKMEENPNEYRIFAVYESKITKSVPGTEKPAYQMTDFLVMEFNEYVAENMDKLAFVAYLKPEYSYLSAFQTPTAILLREGETVAQIKERLNIKEKRVKTLIAYEARQVPKDGLLKDDDVVLDKFNNLKEGKEKNPSLYFIYPQQKSKGQKDESVKIYN